MKAIDQVLVEGQGEQFALLAPEVINDYVETLGKPCQNPLGYTAGSLILAKDLEGVQRMFKVTANISSSQNVVEGTNVERKKLEDLFDGIEEEIGDVDQELGSVKQALSDEVTTRATLGAHNIMPLTLSNLKALNSGLSFDSANNKFSGNGIDYFINLNSRGEIESIKVNGTSTAITWLVLCTFASMNLEDGKKYIINGCQNQVDIKAFFQIQNNGSGVLNVPAAGYTFTYDSSTMSGYQLVIRTNNANNPSNVLFYPMIRIEEDADTTYRPYVPTNAELLSADANAVLGAHNIAKPVLSSYTNQDVAFTPIAKGGININGTGSAANSQNTNVADDYPFMIPAGSWKLLLSGTTRTDIRAMIRKKSDDSVIGSAYINEPLYFTVNSDAEYYVVLIFNTASVQINENVYYMVCLATDSYAGYEPYSMTNQQLTKEKMSIADLKTVVGASSDFSDFKTRIAAL